MKRRQLGASLVLSAAAIGVALVAGELLVRWVSPVEYLSPRYQFAPQYGLMLFPDVVMVHGVPGRYRFHYTVNEDQYRGPRVDPGASALPVVVTLGDSYTFGMGVRDGEEYPAVMHRALAGRWQVVNLASPGWGLTQQIRRYCEFGVRFHPKVVVLQFCSNDLEDNLANRVTAVRDGELVFQDSRNSLNGLKRRLSRSFLQRTQLYNFLRTRASPLVHGLLIRREGARLEKTLRGPGAPGGDATPMERVYNDLLRAFAARLSADGVALIVISVDHQLDGFPATRALVHELDARGDLRYLEVTEWLAGKSPYDSPEGHAWGTKAHRVIGERLADAIAAAPATADPTPAAPR